MMMRAQLWALVLTVLATFSAVKAAEVRAQGPEQGMFLVADEQLVDPRFRKAVILLIHYDTLGAAGLVVNRSSRLPLASVLTEGSRLAGEEHTLAYGGPVEPNALLALVQVRDNPPEQAEQIFDRLYVTGVEVLEEWPGFSAEVLDYKVFVGYTGWAAGQLDSEMSRGDWHLVHADTAQIFSAGRVDLWDAVRSGAGIE